MTAVPIGAIMPAMTLTEAAFRFKSRRPGACPPLLLVTDPARLADPLPAAASLPVGTGILLRHYGRAERPALARALATLARRRRLALLVAADWRLAAAVGAAGIHLPEDLLRSGRLAPLLGWARRRGRLVTCACHGRAALALAGRLGLDAALLSPVFATASHPGAPALGVLRFRQWVRTSRCAVLALGGIRAATLGQLRHSGAAGVAAIGALSPDSRIFAADDPRYHAGQVTGGETSP